MFGLCIGRKPRRYGRFDILQIGSRNGRLCGTLIRGVGMRLCSDAQRRFRSLIAPRGTRARSLGAVAAAVGLVLASCSSEGSEELVIQTQTSVAASSESVGPPNTSPEPISEARQRISISENLALREVPAGYKLFGSAQIQTGRHGERVALQQLVSDGRGRVVVALHENRVAADSMANSNTRRSDHEVDGIAELFEARPNEALPYRAFVWVVGPTSTVWVTSGELDFSALLEIVRVVEAKS
jgi:hypothetical protein